MMKNKISKKQKKNNYYWADNKGNTLYAGGILPYDNEGVWLIAEKMGNKILWTDPGGKYRFEDGDIYMTCSREFNEELYNSTCLTRDHVVEIAKTHYPVFVNGHQNTPVYVCYIVHTSKFERYGIRLSPEKFEECRARVIRENPQVPEKYYNSLELRHFTYDEIKDMMKNHKNLLSYRIKKILTNSEIM